MGRWVGHLLACGPLRKPKRLLRQLLWPGGLRWLVCKPLCRRHSLRIVRKHLFAQCAHGCWSAPALAPASSAIRCGGRFSLFFHNMRRSFLPCSMRDTHAHNATVQLVIDLHQVCGQTLPSMLNPQGGWGMMHSISMQTGRQVVSLALLGDTRRFSADSANGARQRSIEIQ